MNVDNKVLRRLDFQRGRFFEVVTGDLLSEETDTIVNAANSNLAHGGGVALAVASADRASELPARGHSAQHTHSSHHRIRGSVSCVVSRHPRDRSDLGDRGRRVFYAARLHVR